MPSMNLTKKSLLTGLLALVMVLALAPAAWSQAAGSGAIGGTVQDPSGAVVAGAEVTVKSLDTGAERKFTTTEAGIYNAPYLQPGRYEVRVRAQGFAEVIRQELRLEVGQKLVIDFDLPLKAAQETVTVTGEIPLVETEKFDVSQVVGQEQVENLPLNGRRWDNLALLTPGAGEDGGFGGISFRGINSLYNNNMVDGADNNQAFFSEARGRTRIAYGYSINSIKEFQVQTAAYTAEYGRAAGGVVNAVTKSGGNDWHGDFFYFIRDKAFLARDPVGNATATFDIATGTLVTGVKPDERRQQFGGSVSGPIVKEKLFFYLNYDQQKRNFPAIIIPFGGTFFNGPTGSNPAGTSTLPGGTSPSQVQRCTNANCQTVIDAIAELSAITPRKGDQNLGLAKVDYQWDANNRVSGVFNILRWNSPNGIFTGPTSTSTALSNGTDNVQNEFITVTWSSVLSATWVNEARFQYGRDFESQIPNASGPQIQITDSPNFGMPNFLPRGAFPNEKRFQWLDNVSWIKGRHQVKFGIDINHVRDRIQNLFQGGGIYSYQNSTGNGALNKFVTDLFTSSKQYSTFTQNVDPITQDGRGFFTTNDYNFYFQNNWKIRPNFTLNLGIRYELQDMPDVVQAFAGVPETGMLNTDTNNFAPRIGFSWGLGREQKGVIRGGYGLYYGRTQNSSLFVHLFQNGVFQQSYRVTPSSPAPAATCTPVVPNTLFPQPITVGATTPIFGSSSSSPTNPTPTSLFASLADFLTACPAAAASAGVIDVLDPTFVNPLVHQYDIAYERELWWKLGLTVSYVGSRGNHLPAWVDANLPAPDTTRTYVVLSDGTTSATPVGSITVPFFSGAVPRPNSAASVILMGKSVLNSWYNGLVVRVRRRESKGFSFDANYTWSKAWDNGQVAGVNGTFAGTNSPLNPYDLKAEYGLSDLDIRNRFIANIYWVLPFGNWTDSEVGKAVLGGWKAASIWRFNSGRPVEMQMSSRPTCASGFNGGLTCGAVSGTGGAVNGRAPLLVRNTNFTTPRFVDFDLRIAREFKITERARVEFLWEAFNLFNHRLVVPSSGIAPLDNRAFSFSTASAPNMPDTRVCETTFNPGLPSPLFGGCLVPDTRFLAISSTGNTLYGARQMQFGVKISF